MLEYDNKVRLTPSEFNELRRDAAKNGHVVNQVESSDEYDQALCSAAPPGFLDAVVEMIETGAGPEEIERSLAPYKKTKD